MDEKAKAPCLSDSSIGCWGAERQRAHRHSMISHIDDIPPEAFPAKFDESASPALQHPSRNNGPDSSNHNALRSTSLVC